RHGARGGALVPRRPALCGTARRRDVVATAHSPSAEPHRSWRDVELPVAVARPVARSGAGRGGTCVASRARSRRPRWRAERRLMRALRMPLRFAAVFHVSTVLLAVHVAGAQQTCYDVETFAGRGVGDGGPGLQAVLIAPRNVAVDTAGNIFIADSGNSRIR